MCLSALVTTCAVLSNSYSMEKEESMSSSYLQQCQAVLPLIQKKEALTLQEEANFSVPFFQLTKEERHQLIDACQQSISLYSPIIQTYMQLNKSQCPGLITCMNEYRKKYKLEDSILEFDSDGVCYGIGLVFSEAWHTSSTSSPKQEETSKGLGWFYYCMHKLLSRSSEKDARLEQFLKKIDLYHNSDDKKNRVTLSNAENGETLYQKVQSLVLNKGKIAGWDVYSDRLHKEEHMWPYIRLSADIKECIQNDYRFYQDNMFENMRPSVLNWFADYADYRDFLTGLEENDPLNLAVQEFLKLYSLDIKKIQQIQKTSSYKFFKLLGELANQKISLDQIKKLDPTKYGFDGAPKDFHEKMTLFFDTCSKFSNKNSLYNPKAQTPYECLIPKLKCIRRTTKEVLQMMDQEFKKEIYKLETRKQQYQNEQDTIQKELRLKKRYLWQQEEDININVEDRALIKNFKLLTETLTKLEKDISLRYDESTKQAISEFANQLRDNEDKLLTITASMYNGSFESYGDHIVQVLPHGNG